VPRHIARLVTRLVAPLIVDYSGLVFDYFVFVARPGASARRAARHAARRATHRRLLRARRRLLRLRRASGCLDTSHDSSCGSSRARRRLLRLAQARCRLLRLCRASGCLGTSRGSSGGLSRRSSSTTPPRPGSSSTSLPRPGSSSTTSSSPRVWVPRHVARLVIWLVAPLVVIDYFVFAARPGASARRTTCHAARHAARRRLLGLAQARCRLLRLCRVSGCLCTSRGSSCGSSRRSSSTTPPRSGSSSTTPPHVRVPRHVARLVTRLVTPLVVDYSASRRLVVDYFVFAARPGVSARRAARHAARRAARRRLLRLAQARRRLLCRMSECLGTSRGSSRGSSRRSSSTTLPTPRVRVPRHVARPVTRLIIGYSVRATSSCGHAGSTSATLCVVTTCLAAKLALLRVRHAPPRCHLPVASRRPFISTSFPN
jgi:hypothetical protein